MTWIPVATLVLMSSMLAIDIDAQTTSFWRAGGTLWLGPLYARGELLTDGADVEAITASAVVGIDL